MSNHRPARRSGHYFQVPLCAFAFGASKKARLDAIISFGVITAGEKRWNSLDELNRLDLLKTLKMAGKIPIDYKRGELRHAETVIGADVINVRLGSIRDTLARHDALWQFQTSFALRHGPDPLVRLKSALVFEARDGNGIKPSELAVLAAIFSVVGNKQGPVRITQDTIRRRALGYKTQGVLDAEFAGRTDGAEPLSDWKLRSMLDRLHVRKFFARATYGCRLTYYSHRMNDSQLRQAISDRKTYPFASKMLARIDDKAMTDSIRNQRAAAAGKPPPVPGAGPLTLSGKIVAEQVF